MCTKSKILVFTIGVVFAMMVAGGAHAADRAEMQSEIHKLERQWAHITYEMKDEDAQDKAMRALLDVASGIVDRYPYQAEAIIWKGVIASSEAKYAGMFSSLGFAKQARKLFETAGRIDYRALGGAVPTSLGALYYLVPGFPIGFGDNDKARRYLEQGVAMSPAGLDANYFYGDFLYREGEYEKATKVLRRGLSAPRTPDRPVWDSGRRAEIRALLTKIREKLASNG